MNTKLIKSLTIFLLGLNITLNTVNARANSDGNTASKPLKLSLDSNTWPMAIQHHYSALAAELLSSLSPKQAEQMHRDFNDTLRHKWQREPGQRNGLKLTDFTEEQKRLFHKLLRSSLSTQDI